jgi:hypothetical protein
MSSALLEALGIAIATAAECTTEAERCGWIRLSCIDCGRGMPAVTLQHRGPFLVCVDRRKCRLTAASIALRQTTQALAKETSDGR